MSYRPRGNHEVLWGSPSAAFEISNAMRGGIPVCWPWFADHHVDPIGMPIHGIARTQRFNVIATRMLTDGGVQVCLAIEDSPATLPLWPYAFKLDVTITVSSFLSVEWTAHNPGDRPYHYTGALHPYFFVSNVRDLTLHGLEGTDYLDKYDQNRRKHQDGPVSFHASIDNVYVSTTSDMAIEDPGFRRTIHLRKHGSRTSVVWNPGLDDAAMPDVGAGQHPFFVCVEAANAANDVVTVMPGEQGKLGMEIECENWKQP